MAGKKQKTQKSQRSQQTRSRSLFNKFGRSKFIALAAFLVVFGSLGVYYINQSRAAYGYVSLCGGAATV